MSPALALVRVAQVLRRLADAAEREARLLLPPVATEALAVDDDELPPAPLPIDPYDAPGAFAGDPGAFPKHERTYP